MIEIRASRVHFYSQLDEDSFINWLEKILSIVDMRGEVEDIVLFFKDQFIPDADLGELIALHSRYHIDKKHLSIFRNENNENWFLIQICTGLMKYFNE